MPPSSRRPPDEARSTRTRAVASAEAYVRAHLDSPVPVSRLCRMVGVSERSLRNAFHDVHGVSPKRWMVAERLRSVRRALCEHATDSVTVTVVATDHGFSELGRFAATYRHAYGEKPSATLRTSHRAPPASPTKGYVHV